MFAECRGNALFSFRIVSAQGTRSYSVLCATNEMTKFASFLLCSCRFLEEADNNPQISQNPSQTF